jgi:Ca2+-binding EF-hand superfamily protein
MNFIQQLTAMSISYLAASCASVNKTYEAYTDWDTNNDQKIGRSEFVEAYLDQGYFDRWGAGAGSIAYDELFVEAFESIDTDRDENLSLVEFSSQIKLFYFGLFSESFDRWDDDSNASISKSEFTRHVAMTNLVSLWDTDSNRRITEREMAGGMFYICDADSNGSIDQTELNTWKRNRETGVQVKNM